MSPNTIATQHGQSFVPLAFVVTTWEPVEKTVDVPGIASLTFLALLPFLTPPFLNQLWDFCLLRSHGVSPSSQALAMTGDQAWDKGSLFALKTHPVFPE